MQFLKKISLAVATLLSLNSHAYVACDDKEIYNEVSTAAVRRDMDAFTYLVYQSGHCITTDTILKNNLKYSVVDYGWATSKIRVYSSRGSVVLYVQTEFLQSQGKI